MKYAIISQFIVLSLVILLFNPLTGQLFTYYYAGKYNLDKAIYFRQIKAESYFRCFIESPKGAIGIGQVLYTTAEYLEPTIKLFHLYIPWKNLDLSGRYMQYLLNRYKGNYSLALAAYNWGETNVDNHLRANGIRRDSIEIGTNYAHLFTEIRETYQYLEKIIGINPL